MPDLFFITSELLPTLNDNTRAADYYQRAYDLKADPI